MVKICHLENGLLYFLGSRTLFDPSVGSAGSGYSNPSHYLEIALVNTGLEWDKIVDAVDTAAACQYFLHLPWIIC